MKAHATVGDVVVRWVARDGREVRRMLSAAGSVALDLAKPDEPEQVDKPPLGFAAGKLDPDR